MSRCTADDLLDQADALTSAANSLRRASDSAAQNLCNARKAAELDGYAARLRGLYQQAQAREARLAAAQAGPRFVAPYLPPVPPPPPAAPAMPCAPVIVFPVDPDGRRFDCM